MKVIIYLTICIAILFFIGIGMKQGINATEIVVINAENDCEKYEMLGYETRVGYIQWVMTPQCLVNVSGDEYTAYELDEVLRQTKLDKLVEMLE